MTKPITTLIFIQFLLCQIGIAQCDFNDPLAGLTAENSIFLCGDVMDGFTSTLPTGVSPGIQPSPLCKDVINGDGGGQVDNIVWFSFIATSFSVNIQVHYNNCSDTDGYIQTGIYGDLEFSEAIICNPSPASSPATLTGSGFIPGQIYYLFVDGSDETVCDFEIDVLSGINSTPLSFEWEDGNDHLMAEQNGSFITDEHFVCTNADSLYTYRAPTCFARSGSLPIPDIDQFDLYCYEWTISPPGGGVIVSDPNAKEIEIDWQLPGDYTVEVNIIPHPDLAMCANDICTDVLPIIVRANPASEVTNDTIYICPGQVESFCGELIAETTTRTCIPDFGSCEIVTQPFKLYESDTLDYGVQVNCGSNCFQLFGFEYCSNGEYVIQDPVDCFRFHEFTIEGFFVDIDIPSVMELNCSSDAIDIIPIINTNYQGDIEFRWEENGSEYQTDSILSINRTGNFTFIVEFPALGNSCEGSASVQIVENINAPEFTLNVPTIDCDTPIGTLSFVEVDPVDSISWEDGNGFQSNQSELTLNAGGTFTLFIRGENGCTTDTTVTVMQNDDQPIVELTFNNIDCDFEESKATFTSNLEVMSSDWLLTDNIVINADSLTTSIPGNYQLTVTAANGCSTIIPFTVSENISYPIIEAGEDQIWQCNTEQLDIEGQVESGPYQILWNFIELGEILTEASEPNIQVGGPGTYILNVTNADNGCISRDSVVIARNNNIPEFVETFITDPSCYDTNDGLIQITDISGGTEPYSYYLDGIQTEGNVDFMDDLSAGTYTLLIRDAFDCEWTEEIVVEEQAEILVDAPLNVDIGYNENFTFEAFHNIPESELDEIFWYDENGNLIGTGSSIMYVGLEETTLTVEVQHLNGCSAVSTIRVNIDNDVDVYAPTVFSPNEDGVNDMFTIYARDYPGQVENLSIFDRWGELVFSINNLAFNDESNGWDGTKNGTALQPAVYTYMAKIRLLDDTFKLVKGDVTIIK